MTVIICVDKNNGMSFGGKRQTKDRKLREFLLDIAEREGLQIAMTPYSYEQFKEDERDALITVKENFSFDEDYVFLEHNIPVPWNKVDKLFLCCWNREYPTDEYFSLPIGVECEFMYSDCIIQASHEELIVETYAVHTKKWYK